MTADQKQRLASHVAWHKPRRFNGKPSVNPVLSA